MDIKILLGTFVRQLLTGIGAVLVAKGIVSPDDLNSLLDSTTGLIVGGILAAGAYIWSLVSKKKALEEQPPIK